MPDDKDIGALVASPHFQRARVAMGKRADSLSGDALEWEAWMDLVADWLEVVELFGEEHPFPTLCLLALVREAWGDPCIHVCGDGITWCVENGNLDSITTDFIETEAEALTAALLAAPPKGGE